MSTVRVRFAPSPTGYLHIGSFRTAFFDWLWARKNNGKFILRIEDTDRSRYVPGAVENILEALKWYGLDFDEGPIFQSERLDLYRKYARKLVEKGGAYHCFCTEERLDQIRKIQEANKLPTGYDGLCRTLAPEDVQRRLTAGEAYVIRQKIPNEGLTSFHDIVRGQVAVANTTLDDTVLLKSDSFPTYHLAHVIDDHEMAITHVIRAEEWLPSTPRHVLLYKAFGWIPPIYAHPALVLGTDRSKLSKRHGATSALEYRELGYLPEAVLNFIVLLGWNPKDDREIFTREELIKEFDLSKLNKAGAIFNIEKLDWLNGQYIKKMPLKDLAEKCKPWLDGNIETYDLEKVVALFHDRMKKLSDIRELSAFLFSRELEYLGDLLIPKGGEKEDTVRGLSLSCDILKSIGENDFVAAATKKVFEEFIKQRALTTKGILWPLRVAVTGLAQSPGVFEVMEVLGKAEAIRRVEMAIGRLK
ncbi:MAG: glutamate--tRNA ligase [Patescibacteria group bacterium]|jgi:glutamyl-tRNA synthetase